MAPARKKTVKKKVTKKKSTRKPIAKKPATRPAAPAQAASLVAAPAVAAPRLPPDPVLVFDTETTGLIDNHTVKLERQPHIFEFYGCVVDLNSGEVSAELDVLIKPPVPLSEEITKITGMTNDLLADKLSFAEHGAGILAFVQSSAPLAIAHNASFDKEMIDIEYERLSIEVAWPRLLCTVEQTVHLRGFRLNLSGLHQHLFNEPFAGAHRARVDVAALTRCCVELRRREVI